MKKVTNKTRNASRNSYSTVAPNIQRIETASGTTKYRVRFGTPNGEISEYATSMKKAYEVRKRLAA